MRAKLVNVHVLVHDLDGLPDSGTTLALENNVHYIPYKVNLAYTPRKSARPAAIVSEFAATRPQAWDFPTVNVRFTAHFLKGCVMCMSVCIMCWLLMTVAAPCSVTWCAPIPTVVGASPLNLVSLFHLAGRSATP